EPVVAACVRERTDYVDITGEPSFVDGLLARYDASARANNVRIVNCCGFDSVPHDLGAYFTVERLPRGAPITVEAFVQMKGSFSGGTFQSAMNEVGNTKTSTDKPKETRPIPFGRRVRGAANKIHYDRQLRGWVCPLPTIDPQIVLRSAA